MDNFEHLLTAAAGVAEILAAALHVTVLVTSREALRISGEQRYPHPALSLPIDEGDERDSVIALDRDLESLADSEAVRLFEMRAQAVLPEFRITSENVQAVSTICRRLDGLPLANELAAARVELFSPSAMVGRFEKPLGLADAGGPDRPERHRALRATIDWSYDLLTAEEQALFRHLSVFVGCGTGNHRGSVRFGRSRADGGSDRITAR